MNRILPFSFVCSLALGHAVLAQTPETVFGKVHDAFVEIVANGRNSGSGVIAHPGGRVLTAAHVIADHRSEFEVLSPVMGRLPARLIVVDLGHDIALLQLPIRDEDYPAVELAEEPASVGDELYLYGAPIFRRPMLQRGMCALSAHGFEYYSKQHLYVSVQYISATIQHGTSGGPWLNKDGKMVGIQSGSLLTNGAMAGVAFAGPLHAAKELLKGRDNAATPTLGMAVEELWQHKEDQLKRFPPGTEGLVARVMRPDGPAVRAGIKQWDLIQSIDGRPVRRVHELLEYVRTKRPEDEVRLVILAPDGAGKKHLIVRLAKLEIGWSKRTI